MRDYPHLNDTQFPNVNGVNAYKYRNTFDYEKYDKTQMSITVCSVPWDVGLIHVGNAQIGGLGNVVHFDTKAKRDAWFDTLENKYTWRTKYRDYHDGGYIEVPLPYEQCVLFNYVYCEYTPLPVEYGDGGKDKFFFFIRSCEYLSPNSTKIELLRDTWQTYIYDVNINYMMLERGHAPLAITSADDYLANPIENTNYLLADDVNYGHTYTRRIAGSAIINAGAMWAIIITSADPQGKWGTKDDSTWNTPNDAQNFTDGAPSLYAMAVAPNRLTDFLSAINQNIPQFIQTIKGVFFISKILVSLGNSFTFADETCYLVQQQSVKLKIADLNKAMFNYGMHYEDLAKLYTYPYAYLEIGDDTGNVRELRIEETSGNLSLTVTTSLAFPFIKYDGRVNGVGGNKHVISFSNINEHSFSFDAGFLDYLYEWNIPSFSVTQSAESIYDYSTDFERKQKALELQTSKTNADNSARAAKANADMSADTAKANADASANIAKTNADNSADTDKTNADNSADTDKTNADNSANTAYQNTINVASASQTNANANALTAQTNTLNENQMQSNNASLGRQQNSLQATANQNLASFMTSTQADVNLYTRNADIELQNATVTAEIDKMNAEVGNTAAQTFVTGALNGGVAGASAGPVGAAAGAISGALGSGVSVYFANVSNNIAVQATYEVADAHRSNMIAKTALQNQASFDMTNQQNAHTAAQANRANYFNEQTVSNAKSTSDANANRSYNTATNNATRNYNTDSANAANTRDTSITNNKNTYNTAIANAANTKSTANINAANMHDTALNNNQRTHTTTLSNNTNTYNTALTNNTNTYNTGVAGIQAGVNQAALNAPSEFGETRNAETATTRPQGLFCNVVTQAQDAIEQAGDYFLRFGYAINRAWNFETFNIMPKFTYWKASDMWVSGNNVPDAYLDEIRFYLLGGVCVWRAPEDIGNISIYDNYGD